VNKKQDSLGLGVNLVSDLGIAHERWGSISDPTLNGNWHYPNDADMSIKKTARRLENITRTIITIPLTLSPYYLLVLVRLGGYIVNLYVFYSYRLIGKLTVFF